MSRVVASVMLAASMLVSAASAQDRHADSAGRHVTLPPGAVVNQDYFAYGERVEISGTVNGDVFAAGGQILVDGTVNGDVLAAGGTITISGTVSQDARLAGGQIAVNGAIGRNLTVVGGNVEVSESAVVGRGVAAAGGRIRMAAPVAKDAKVAAGSLTISNAIKGNLHAATGDLRLTSKASIAGDLTYWSQAEASIDPAANVAGVITHQDMPEYRGPTPRSFVGALAGLFLLAKVVSLVSTLVLGLLFLSFLPRFTGSAVSTLKTRPWASLGIGFVALVVTPAAAGMLLLTVLGAPLALLLGALYLSALYVARVFVILWAGIALFAWTGRQVRPGWALVAGLLIYGILTVVPFVGGLIASLATTFGLGAALLADRAPVRTASV